VLDLDPDLGSGIAEDEWQLARRSCRADLIDFPTGEFDLVTTTARGREDVIAGVVAGGLVVREHSLARHRTIELLCSGDVLLLSGAESTRPPGTYSSVTALTRARVILLGRPFLVAAARWPSLMVNLNQRVEGQRQRLVAYGLAAHLPRATHRILLTLWLLADQCGRVTSDGVLLPLQFTQDVLGQLIAARRPTVTLALGELTSAGLLLRNKSGQFVLTEGAAREIAAITTAENEQAVAPSITLKRPTNHAAVASDRSPSNVATANSEARVANSVR
jgi:CRP-like cAMP-binding protein